MPLKIVRNDITEMRADAIVNSANHHAAVGGGIDRAIHKAAGAELLAARKKIGDIATGDAAITPAYNLHAKYVILTGVSGPLRGCIRSCPISRATDPASCGSRMSCIFRCPQRGVKTS